MGGCPSCGEPVIAGHRFCHSCGHVLDGSAAAPPVSVSAPPGAAAGPVAERRLCSVLFCDVVGFTPLSESRDPEAVRELLSRYFETARTVIGRYGGVVEKFIGDAVMAVWGTPVAAEGDAERAVRAALELVTSVAELGAEAGVAGLAARAGVVTGEVAVTLGATHEGMVAGDAVNTAARVQAVAEPGSVLVDGPTQRLAERGVGFAGAGEHTLKGKAEPQRLWRATWVLSGVGGLKRLDGLEAPLIGRDAELRTVKELFHAAAERRVPRLGLADTATTTELLTMLDGHQPGELPPMLRAERGLARARLSAADGGPDAETFAAAITGLRQHSTPYHLAHGLLDHAQYLLRAGDDGAAKAGIGEARGIAERLGCQPLLDRADTIQPARSRTAAS